MSFSRKKELPALPANNTAPQTPSQAFSNSGSDLSPQRRRSDRDNSLTQPPGLAPLQKQLPTGQSVLPWSAHRLILQPRIVLNKPGIGAPISTLSPPPFPRCGHSVPANAGRSGEFYIFGGLVREFARNDVYLFSTQDNSVSLMQTTGLVPSPRAGHASAFFSDVLIVWGGETNTDPISDKHDNGLYLLNLLSREWRLEILGHAPVGRYGHAVTMVGAKFFVFGGQVNGEFLNDLWVLDLQLLKTSRTFWELCEPTSPIKPAPRTSHICVTFKDQIIVFGGKDGKYHYNDTWSFSLQTRKWTELQCIGFIPCPREGHAAAIVGNVIYIFGGRGVDGKELSDLVAFNISDQRWHMLQNMGPSPSGRYGHAMPSIGTKVYVLGGESFSPFKSYDPSIAHVLDTKHITFPQDNEGPPAPAAPTRNLNTTWRPSVTQNPQNIQGHPPSLPHIGGRSISPNVALERAISLVGFGPGVTKQTSSSIIAGNGKGKAPVRPKREDGKLNAQESRYDMVSPEPFAMRERTVSHDQGTRTNRIAQTSVPSRSKATHALNMIGVSMGINNRSSAAGTGWASPTTRDASPASELPRSRGESYSAVVAPASIPNESVRPASRTDDGSVGNVSADLLRDLEVKDLELDNLRKQMARMKEALANAARAGYVQAEMEDTPDLSDEPPPYS